MFVLDTDTCSYILKNRPSSVRERFGRLRRSELMVSEVVAAELYYGAQRHPSRSEAIRGDVDDFLSRLTVLPSQGAQHYARVRHALESKGMNIGNMDLFVTAHALDAILVTNNLAHFCRIQGLNCETWVS